MFMVFSTASVIAYILVLGRRNRERKQSGDAEAGTAAAADTRLGNRSSSSAPTSSKKGPDDLARPKASTPRAINEIAVPSAVNDTEIGDDNHDFASSSGSGTDWDSKETTWSKASSVSSRSTSNVNRTMVTEELETCKQQAVDNLMTEFKALLSHGLYVGLSIRAGGRGVSVSPRRVAKFGLSPSSSSPGDTVEWPDGIPRGQSYIGAGTQTTDGQRRSRALPQASLEEEQRRFACPFYQRNPRRHTNHRSCRGPGWANVYRIKEHIYRTHTLPIHCSRCGMIMKSDSQLWEHQRQAEGCQVRLVDLPEGINTEQEKQLRKKKQRETEEDRWLEMYRILFPDEDGDLVPSPYYDDCGSGRDGERIDELRQYERFQRRELLRIVRRLLQQENVFDLEGPFESQLRARFEKIVRQAQREVFSLYRSGAGPCTDNNGSNISVNAPTPENQELVPSGTPYECDPSGLPYQHGPVGLPPYSPGQEAGPSVGGAGFTFDNNTWLLSTYGHPRHDDPFVQSDNSHYTSNLHGHAPADGSAHHMTGYHLEVPPTSPSRPPVLYGMPFNHPDNVCRGPNAQQDKGAPSG
ncbi:hypothetical protein B0T26DRAFT_669566 [Lasiosphaeria miniovina]|uniref:C2H2-type domain-containing protein n=1 Tax=Lasiosphaeria miniovina TaxID=1954250 RepID=A0AA40EF93_9PEZI|nr:uncharacterized protein B0T26DRAFT_669566 [Lasiosphaeria miniovina]KAK0733128.1 hypothetical protein B0T26DRAFT_669566 [Lasiosphaeria miniovina]